MFFQTRNIERMNRKLFDVLVTHCFKMMIASLAARKPCSKFNVLFFTLFALTNKIHGKPLNGGSSVDSHKGLWAYDVTWFQLQPEDSFVIRNNPATLTCRVASALKVYFSCNGQTVPTKKQSYQNFTHGNTGAPITEVQLNVTRDDIQKYLSTSDAPDNKEYRCECVAWNKRGSKKSQSAKVQYAYLKRYFVQQPYSKSVEVDSQTELRCIPPDGVPHTVISWIKDSRHIDPGPGSNYILTADGHLLIVQTRLADMGNYSCIAENIANRRVSEPALLTVYMNGGWSPWSSWGECQGPCGIGYQLRTRTCTDPSPINGGRPCTGSSEQKQECHHSCPPVDGGWSPWTSWETCEENCEQHKHRSCTSPTPSNGGRQCFGRNLQTRNCTGGYCNKGSHGKTISNGVGSGTRSSPPSSPAAFPDSRNFHSGSSKDHGRSDDSVGNLSGTGAKNQDARAIVETDISLYIILGVVLMLLIVISIITVRFMRRRGRDHVMYGMAFSDHPTGYFPSPPKKLGMQPDLTVSTANGNVNSFLFTEYSYPPNQKNLTSTESLPLHQAGDRSEHLYAVPHLHNVQQNSTILSDMNSENATEAGQLGSPISTKMLNHQSMETSFRSSVTPVLIPPPTSSSIKSKNSHLISMNGQVYGNLAATSTERYSPSSPDSDSVSYISFMDKLRPSSLMCQHEAGDRNGKEIVSMASAMSHNSSNNNNNNDGMNFKDNVYNRDSVTSMSPLLEGVDPEYLLWAQLTHASGVAMCLKDTGVTLTIPEGAVSKSEDVFCAILTDEKEFPKLSDGQTLLSPVISCGGARSLGALMKPAIISFQHCASLKYGGWKITLYFYEQNHSMCSTSSSGCSNGFNDASCWKKIMTIGKETADCPAFVHLDSNQAFIVTDRLGKFAFIGESETGMGQNAVKTLRLAVFSGAIMSTPTANTQTNFTLGTSNSEYAIKVYVMNDTAATFDRVIMREKRMGNKVLDKPKSLLFQNGGGNLCISIEDAGAGWKCRRAYQELSFNQLWSGKQSDACCTFILDKTDRRHTKLSFRLLAYQTVHLQKLTFRIRAELGNPKSKGTTMNQPSGGGLSTVNESTEISSCPDVSSMSPKSATVTMSSGCSSIVTSEHGDLFRLPKTIKQKLCQCLDETHPNGSDWRLLAKKLGLERFTAYIATRSSPTEYILELWDAKTRKPEALTDLLNALRLMERQDAVAILEKEVGPWI